MNHINLKTDFYDAAPLFKLEIAKYRLSFSLKSPINIQKLVPVLRSRLGYILKGRFCPFQNYQVCSCKNCQNSPDCIYINLFSPTHESITTKFKGKGKSHSNPPRPYSLDVLFENPYTEIVSQEPGQIELTLFGEKAIQYKRPMLESIIHAMASIHISHLSTDSDKNNIIANPVVPLSWKAVIPEKTDQYQQLVFKDEDYIITNRTGESIKNWFNALPAPIINHDSQEIPMLDVLFRTPVQLGRISEKLTFTVFIQSIISRLRDLKRIYHPDNDMGDFSEIFHKKSDSISTFSNLKNISLSRYSYNQKKNIMIGGLTGNLIFEGDIGPFLPLLAAGSLIGVGKKTVYGLGRFELSYTHAL